MTEPTSHGGHAGSGLPEPSFFDPSFERIPASAAADPATPGPVLLLYDPSADRAWVADAAIALATAWAQSGRRTVLADLSLGDPILHERIGMANLDGVVDIFLYGASLARSARTVPGRGFYLISSGTYTPDEEAVFRHPRWEKIVSGFREAGAALLVFAPARKAEVEGLGSWATEVVLLGPARAAGVFGEVLDGRPVRAWLAPPAGPGDARESGPLHAAPAPGEIFPEPEPVPAFGHPVASARHPVPPPESFPSAEATVGASTEALPVPDPEWERGAEPAAGKVKIPSRKRGRGKDAVDPGVATPGRRISPILLGILVLVLVGAAWYFVREYRPALLPAWLGGTATAAAAASGPGGALSADGVASAGTALPYAVFVKAYPTLGPAQQAATAAAARFPEAPFYVIPESTQGQIWYKVYAGVLSDTADAASVRGRLVERKMVDDDDVGGPSALILHRPLSFDLGDAPTREGAEARADSLWAKAIPAYVVPVPFADGQERWKVYGGAFADSAGAEPMRRLLVYVGVPTRLVQRTGRPPASPK